MGDGKIIALNNEKKYKIFPLTDSGVTLAVEWLQEGGTIYTLSYYVDKHGDTLPRSRKAAEVNEEGELVGTAN